MNSKHPGSKTFLEVAGVVAAFGVAIVVVVGIASLPSGRHSTAGGLASSWRSGDSPGRPVLRNLSDGRPVRFLPRGGIDTSGYGPLVSSIPPWAPDDSLATIAESWRHPGLKAIARLDAELPRTRDRGDRMGYVGSLVFKAMLLDSEGQPGRAYDVLAEARSLAEVDPILAPKCLFTLVYFQGVTALRRGENENCIECRGESSCILPISPAAVHTNPSGSRLAIRHFTEYLEQFPSDLEVRWLLNLAHMTLGEHPNKVDPRHLISLDRFRAI